MRKKWVCFAIRSKRVPVAQRLSQIEKFAHFILAFVCTHFHRLLARLNENEKSRPHNHMKKKRNGGLEAGGSVKKNVSQECSKLAKTKKNP